MRIPLTNPYETLWVKRVRGLIGSECSWFLLVPLCVCDRGTALWWGWATSLFLGWCGWCCFRWVLLEDFISTGNSITCVAHTHTTRFPCATLPFWWNGWVQVPSKVCRFQNLSIYTVVNHFLFLQVRTSRFPTMGREVLNDEVLSTGLNHRTHRHVF